MLKKIVSTRNIGKFVDYQCEGDVELRQLNIIYADNDRGLPYSDRRMRECGL
jgi:hypothetical protein